MQKIFEGTVYDVLPKSDGLVFSYQKGTLEEKIIIGFKMLSTSTGAITDVAKNIYLLTKYGSNYQSAAALCENYVTAKAINLTGGRLFVCTTEGDAHFIEGDGEVSWSGSLKYKDRAPSDIVFYKNAIWGCFSQNNVLIRFNTLNMREELRIGGIRSPFESPRNIFIDGNCATVSNADSKKLVRVNLDNYTVEDYYDFPEAVHGYLKTEKREFVILESGLYLF